MKYLYKYLLIIIIIPKSIFGQIYINDTISNNSNSKRCWSILYKDETCDTSKSGDCEIEKVSIEGEKLKLELNYKGGCGEVYFRLFADTIGMKVSKTIKLLLDYDSNDRCLAIYEPVIYFDLKPFEGLQGKI